MRGRLGVLTWGVALFLTLPCSLLAQGIQTPSETLETVLSLVQDNPYSKARLSPVRLPRHGGGSSGHHP